MPCPCLQVLSAIRHDQAWLLGKVASLLEMGQIGSHEAVARATQIIWTRSSQQQGLNSQEQQQPSAINDPQADGNPLSTDQSELLTPLIQPLDATADSARQIVLSIGAGDASSADANSGHLAGCTPHATITAQDILSLGQMLESRFKPGGLLSRQQGIMTMANVMWVLGLLGVCVAFLPAIAPFVAWIAEVYGPVIMMVHHCLLPFYGLFVYSFALYIIAAASRSAFICV